MAQRSSNVTYSGIVEYCPPGKKHVADSFICITEHICLRYKDRANINSDKISYKGISEIEEILEKKRTQAQHGSLFEIYNRFTDLKPTFIRLFFDIDMHLREPISIVCKLDFFYTNIDNLKNIVLDWAINNMCFLTSNSKRLIEKAVNNYVFTYSNDPMKCSYHVYFPNVYLSYELSKKHFRDYMKIVKRNDLSPFIQSVEENMHSSLAIRLPYSIKTPNYTFMHLMQPKYKKRLSDFIFTYDSCCEENLYFHEDWYN